jgi:hypothetical protein
MTQMTHLLYEGLGRWIIVQGVRMALYREMRHLRHVRHPSFQAYCGTATDDPRRASPKNFCCSDRPPPIARPPSGVAALAL